jgi:hypothetical protein
MNRPPTEGATESSVFFEKYGFGFVIVLHALSNGDPIVSRCFVATVPKFAIVNFGDLFST